ncbi:MAG: substrate-binding domain-containing protein [Nitrospirae bacterium]|nr:substrate-binding domain-containing protein [Nitrospirota bacterium]
MKHPFPPRAARFAAPLLAITLLLTAISPAGAAERLRMSTTTSTENSGLLGVLLPPFEQANGVKVDVIAVGTGKALKLGENGDVDVVFVHARGAEEKFVADGFGIDRRDVMHNDFVLVGPAADPAGIAKAARAVDALARIQHAGAPFVSRGDDSGTHQKERALWTTARIKPAGQWYLEAGQGMGAVLTIANEKGAYALTDRGTFIAYRDKVGLKVLFAGDPVLFNPYGIIAVNPARHPHVNHALAEKLMDFITGPEGQRIIAGYRPGGEALFFPDALAPDALAPITLVPNGPRPAGVGSTR